MSTKRARGDEAVWNTTRAGRSAWVGRAMLALIPLAILGATVHHVLQQRVAERWREFSEELQRTPLPETSQAINERVEEAFTPVYDRIPALLDWHYSLRGQTRELVLRASGRLGEEVESRLLGGLEERIGDASEGVGRVMQEEMLAEVERWFGRELASVPPGLGTRYERMLEPILKNTERRFAVSVGPTALGAAMAGMGTSVGVTALASRFAGMLASGAVSAAIRALGRALSPSAGIVGGVAVGLVIDALWREFDESRNREELEQELTALVDKEKEKVKLAISRAADDVKFEALGDFLPFQFGIRNGRPARASTM